MVNDFDRNQLIEQFIYETLELVSHLEGVTLDSEKVNAIEENVDEIFRVVHTIKSSAAMMDFSNLATLYHYLEDVFFYIRENQPRNVNYTELTDIVLRVADFTKQEVNQIQEGTYKNSDISDIISEINELLDAMKKDNGHNKEINTKINKEHVEEKLYPGKKNSSGSGSRKNHYKALLLFEEGCEMENMRAFAIVHNLKKISEIISYFPEDIIENNKSAEVIQKNGFEIEFKTELDFENVKSILSETIFLKDLKLELINPSENSDRGSAIETAVSKTGGTIGDSQGKSAIKQALKQSVKQSMISVNVTKLDKLMDLVGELVISQAMVIQNPDLEGLELNNFNKAASQLQKLTNELQDAVMSIRMVPLSATFQKMHRVVRDMSKKLNKDIKLEIIGEETEVDKNIIEHLSDPLTHLVRNAVDHGIEPVEERIKKGKSRTGTITLEARNEGGDVWIFVKDDGRGLDKDSILKKVTERGLLKKAENELTDREIYSYIFLPGFSTNDKVTEYSGRGVGLDVVNKNIKEIGGTIQVDSVYGAGMTVSIKIPLTLAILDGMKVRVGKAVYIIPITSIREAFKVQESAIIRDENNNEMIMLRGECYPVIRLHEFFKIKADTEKLTEGVILVVENEMKKACLFADEILGVQQVVLKTLPRYIKKIKGISGCTVTGSGNVSLIIDVPGMLNK